MQPKMSRKESKCRTTTQYITLCEQSRNDINYLATSSRINTLRYRYKWYREMAMSSTPHHSGWCYIVFHAHNMLLVRSDITVWRIIQPLPRDKLESDIALMRYDRSCYLFTSQQPKYPNSNIFETCTHDATLH